MHPLLRIALLFCPRSFRREYEAQIRIDADGARWSGNANVMRLCANVAAAGITLHLEAASQNLLLAVRSLAHARAYAVVSVLTIALAIGANIAVVSAVHGILLSPLPYRDPSNLYYVTKHGNGAGWSYLNAHDYLSASTTLADFGIAGPDSSTLLRRGDPTRLDGKQVDGGYFRVLGEHAELGRLIVPTDMERPVAVLSDALWRARFGADASVIGRTIDLSGSVFRIIGVAPPGFHDPAQDGFARSAYWIPDDRFARAVRLRGDSEGYARLRPGVSLAAAQADLRRVVAQLDRRYPNPAQLDAPSLMLPLLSVIVGDVRPLLWLSYGAVDVLLIIALANVANLALVRACARERELVVRGALGAGRREIAAQLSAESGLLALFGGAIGVAAGYAALRAFAPFGEQILPRWESVGVGVPVGAYAAALVILATIACGLLPVLWLHRDIATALKSAGRSGDRSSSRRFRTALVVAEVALAIAVVISAGLVVRSFVSLTHVDIGFDGSDLAYVTDVTPPDTMMNSFARRTQTTDTLLTRLRAIPGVVGASAAESVPFGRCCIVVAVNVPANSSTQHSAIFNPVSRQYFNLMRIPLLAGREFTAADRLGAPAVALVNRAFALSYFGGEKAALGKKIFPQFDIDSPGKPVTNVPRTIVGVVGDTRESFGHLPRPQVYAAADQFPHFPDYVLRTRGNDAGLANAVTAAVHSLDSSLPPPTVRIYSELFANDALTANVTTLLFAAFAFIALMLALAGVYAVTAYAVEQQTREIGIRRALGARDAQVTASVLGAVSRYAAMGIGGGIVLAAVCSRLLSSLLFQTSPLDSLTYVVAIAIVFACAMLAALIPALRAVRVNPVQALRYE